MDLCDWEKIGRPELLHLVFNALLEFQSTEKSLPQLNNESNATRVLELVKAINALERGEGAVKADIDDDIVKSCALYARA
jgi:ubiquitin-activating enzyme E1